MKRALLLLPLLSALPAYAGFTTEGETCNADLETVDADLLDELLLILPESTVINDAYINTNTNIPVTKEYVGGTLEITFMHEGAGYKNRFGYFVYDPDVLDPDNFDREDMLAALGGDTTADAQGVIEWGEIWENASYRYAGGDGTCLQTGHTAKLELESDWVDHNVGFWLQANGYNTSSGTWWYSIAELNASDDQPHLTLLQTLSNSEMLVMGWEDIDLNYGSCDHDFNDLLMTLTADPGEIITDIIDEISVPETSEDSDGDGVIDILDDFPDDALLATNNVYPSEGDLFTVTFEDLYPAVGDGDYNDLVINAELHEMANADGDIAGMRGGIFVSARGAGYDHEFHLNIEGAGAGSWTITTFDPGGVTVSTVSGTNTGADLDLTIWDSTRDALSAWNTTPAEVNSIAQGQWVQWEFTPDTPVSPDDLQIAPYDPYLYVKNTGYDIHQVGFDPIDGSTVPAGEDYINDQGYPWCLVVPSQWNFPQESVLIDDAYGSFTNWRLSEGASATDWYDVATGDVVTVPDDFFIHDLVAE